LKKEEYAGAAKVAREIAEDTSGSVEAARAWYDAVDLCYKAKDYASAIEIGEQLMATDGLPGHLATSLERLMVLVYYRYGEYEKSLALMDELKANGALERENRTEFAQMRPYCLLCQQDYEEALVACRNVLQDSSLGSKERHRFEELSARLRRFHVK